MTVIPGRWCNACGTTQCAACAVADYVESQRVPAPALTPAKLGVPCAPTDHCFCFDVPQHVSGRPHVRCCECGRQKLAPYRHSAVVPRDAPEGL